MDKHDGFDILENDRELGYPEDIDPMVNLPLGLVNNGVWNRKISFRGITGRDLKIIHDINYRKNHPLTWIARVVCCVTDELFGERVNAEFAIENYKKIPKAVSDLTTMDAGYILIKGHMFTFGNILKNVKDRCMSCGRNFYCDLDLTKLPCAWAGSQINRIEVLVSDGFKPKDVEEVYKVFVFKIPTLGDNIKFEDEYKPNDRGHFDDLILYNSLIEVRTVAGEVMSEEILRTKARNMFDDMSAKDLADINTKFRDLPQLGMNISTECTNCSEEVEVSLDPTMLYPRVSQG